MRQAMRLVREEQGPDAVILSSRRTDEGIEIIAALDYDEMLVREAAGEGTVRPPALPAAAAAAHIASFSETVSGLLRGQAVASAQPPRVEVPAPAADSIVLRRPPAEPAPVAARDAEAVRETPLREELAELRQMLELQLSSLAWNELGRRNPQRARVLTEFGRLGIDSDVASGLLADLPESLNSEQARYLPLGLLARRLPVTAHDPLATGGKFALVGPTGVGKTTTLAKLAARAVAAQGPRGVALISADHFRIAADEQLYRYGRLLGVPVYAATSAAELDELLSRLADHRLVLIDTPGLGYRDARIAELLRALAGDKTPVQTTLVLAANAQGAALDGAIRAYAGLRPGGCVLTKLDEAPTLGTAFSALIRHGLSLDYVTDGQRVPEDLARADAHKLVCRAARQQTDAPLDEHSLAERFGRLALARA